MTRMNSWHSFSPNGRWIVFSSKSRSPYTTHIDENRTDSPPVLVENSKASNRAVNRPEFVNIDRAGMENIDPVVTQYYAVADEGSVNLDKAISHFERALELKPAYGSAHSNLGIALSARNRTTEAIEHLRAGAELTPESADAHNSLGVGSR